MVSMRPSCEKHVLSKLRAALGKIEQWRLAEKVGCSEGAIKRIERGKLKLSDGLAEKIFLATGIAPDWLLNNNFDAPMIEGVKGEPYSRDIYDRIQANKAAPEGSETQGHRMRVIRSLEEILWSFVSAEKQSAQASALAAYRLLCFAQQLKEEFGEERFSYSAKGQKPWAKVVAGMRTYFHEANPLPVLLGDGSEAVLHPDMPYESAIAVRRKNRAAGR